MSEIDLNLAVLDTILPPGECLRRWQIAEIAGCSPQHISQIEAKALAKLRRKLAKEMPERITRLQSKPKPRAALDAVELAKWIKAIVGSSASKPEVYSESPLVAT